MGWNGWVGLVWMVIIGSLKALFVLISAVQAIFSFYTKAYNTLFWNVPACFTRLSPVLLVVNMRSRGCHKFFEHNNNTQIVIAV